MKFLPFLLYFVDTYSWVGLARFPRIVIRDIPELLRLKTDLASRVYDIGVHDGIARTILSTIPVFNAGSPLIMYVLVRRLV